MHLWLFFDLISEIVGRDVHHEVFIRPRCQDRKDIHFVDSRLDKALDTLITDRLVSLRGMPNHRADPIWSTIAERLKSAEKKTLILGMYVHAVVSRLLDQVSNMIDRQEATDMMSS